MEFGKVKSYTVDRTASGYFSPHNEVGKIRRGAYYEFVGFSVNSGLATWIAFDLDQGEAIRIDHYGGQKTEFAPKKLLPTSKRIERTVFNQQLIEIFTRKNLEKTQLSKLVGYANDLWASPPDLPWPATDIHNAIVLLDGNTKKVIGGPGLLPSGAAESLEQELRALFSPEDHQ